MTRRNALIFFLAVVPLLVLDQWSKMWAEDSLATPRHPIPLLLEGESESKSLGELIESRLGPLSNETKAELLSSRVVAFKKSDALTGTEKPFTEKGPVYRALIAFSRGPLGTPPRAIWLRDMQTRLEELKEERPGAAQSELREEVGKELAALDLADYLAKHIPYANKEECEALIAEGRIFAYPVQGREPLSQETQVAGDAFFLVLSHTIPVIDDFLRFSYAENPGAAWGLLGTAPPLFRKLFFIGVSIIAVFAIGFMVIRLREEQILYFTAFGVMLSGAIGNFIDRIRFNYVIDFIDMYIGESHWPTYNVADIAISIGVGLIIVDLLFLTGGEGVFTDEISPEESKES